MQDGPGLFAAPEQVHSLFFALCPDPGTAAALVAARQALEQGLAPERGGGVPPERLHLTLHWLGEWSQLPAATVQAAVAAAASQDQPGFELLLDRADCFGHGEAVWVLRPSAPPPELLGLHAGLGAALARQRLRLPPGPPFAPHVTLRRRARQRLAAGPVPALAWRVSHFELLESVRGTGQSGYRRLGQWPLG